MTGWAGSQHFSIIHFLVHSFPCQMLFVGLDSTLNSQVKWLLLMRRILFFVDLHQGGRKPWHIKMTLFGLYLIRYQPHLSIFESF
jgi:hypothetical protein